MPFIPQRRLDALNARCQRLQERAEAAEREAEVQTAAASRLAQRELARAGTIAGARAALTAPYEEIKARCERLEKANAALQGQLADALGYTPEQRAAIESGSGEPRRATSN